MNLIEQRWVQAVWCDDIRQEIGNKPSLMGVYSFDILMPTLPMVLPRLCVYVQIGTPADRPFKKFRLRVTRNDVDEPLGLIELTMEQLANAEATSPVKSSSDASENDDSRRGLGMNFILQFGPLDFTEKTKWLKVWVDTEEETLESLKLRVVNSAKRKA